MHVTRREFLLQTGQACARLRARRRRVHCRRRALRPDQRLRAGLGLPGAGLRVPGRRQRRQQHGRPDRARRNTTPMPAVRNAPAWPFRATRCCRSRRSASAARSACIRAWSTLQALWDEQTTLGRLQRRPARAAASRARTTRAAPRGRTSCSRTPTRSRSGRPRSPIASRQTGWGGPHRRPLRACTLRLPDDHRAVGRHLHARPDDLAALDRVGADRAQPGARAQRLRHSRRRSRAQGARWTFLRTIDTDPALVRSASRTTQQAVDIGQIAQQRRDARDGVPEHDARQPAEAGGEGHQVQRRRRRRSD